MQNRIKPLPFAIALLAAGGASLAVPQASAQNGENLEEVVITGLRATPATATDSPVAIDVFNAESLQAVSFIETGDILQTLIPSYNISRTPIADGSTFVRPAELRGLPAHYTLVLVDGKRRHRTAMIPPGGSGLQGPDVATIPAAAIESIEVLRDGASSQYGSDAIAGVLNFNLKQNTDGFTLSYDTGQQYEGDGFQQTLQLNFGLPIGDKGFVSVSGEYSDIEFTERSFQVCNSSSFCIDPNNPLFDPNTSLGAYVLSPAFQNAVGSASVEGDGVQPWGQPNNTALRFFVNTGYELANGVELYGYGNYSESLGDGSFFYRQPFAGVLAERRLADGSIWTPRDNFEGPGPNFPAGFTPRFEGEVTDYSALGGIRGTTDTGLNWDVSARYGHSKIGYRLFNTFNPSLGPFSGTDFRPGDLKNIERQIQADFSKEFAVDGLAGPAILSFGLSYMEEEFTVVESRDNASYTPGPWAVSDPFSFCTGRGGEPTPAGLGVIALGSTLDCSNTSDPVFTSFPVGANGFPGYNPQFAGTFDRDSYSAYVDLSAEITEKWLLEGAVRYEDYSDFGDALVGKLATRFYITDNFAIRGSMGTGFRAPTPGQQGTINVSTVLPFGEPVAQGIFPPTSAAAAALGATPLEAEDTLNYTLGFTATLGALTLTVDAYRIEIQDRVNAVTVRQISTNPADGVRYDNFLALQSAGVPNADQLGQVNWFTNAFDTVTTGIDIVATYPVDWGQGHSTNFTFAYNHNEQELDSEPGEFFSPFSLFNFENNLLEDRAVFTVAHDYGNWNIVARANYFGEYSLAQQPPGNINRTDFNTQTFGSEVFIDLEASYQFNDRLRVTVGGRNIFDEYPDNIDTTRILQLNGRRYNSGSLVPWQGGYYFGRITYTM